MLKYKIDVADALERVGFGVYTARKTGFIAQDTIRKLQREETGVTLEAINKLCVILDIDIGSLLEWEMSPEEAERRHDILCRKKHR